MTQDDVLCREAFREKYRGKYSDSQLAVFENPALQDDWIAFQLGWQACAHKPVLDEEMLKRDLATICGNYEQHAMNHRSISPEYRAFEKQAISVLRPYLRTTGEADKPERESVEPILEEAWKFFNAAIDDVPLLRRYMARREVMETNKDVVREAILDDIEVIRNVAGDLDEGVIHNYNSESRRRGNIGGPVSRACDRIEAALSTLTPPPAQHGDEQPTADRNEMFRRLLKLGTPINTLIGAARSVEGMDKWHDIRKEWVDSLLARAEEAKEAWDGIVALMESITKEKPPAQDKGGE